MFPLQNNSSYCRRPVECEALEPLGDILPQGMLLDDYWHGSETGIEVPRQEKEIRYLTRPFWGLQNGGCSLIYYDY
jgi:hypothetical protein